jgi:hypothetical protein
VPVLERRLPALLGSLNQPVTESDLDALKRAIDPYELPAEYETWLRFADGQRHQAGWWPVIDGPLLPAHQVVDFYSVGLQDQPSGLLPISYASHYQVSIELAKDESTVLIETTVSSAEWRIIAPSMPDLIRTVGELAEMGALNDWPNIYRLHLEQVDSDAAIREHQARRSALASISADLLGQSDWSHSPFAQGKWFVREEGPSYWGAFPLL